MSKPAVTPPSLAVDERLPVNPAAFDELAAATQTPVTARRLWLATWARTHPQWRPWIVTVPGSGGRLDGAAPLALRRRRGRTEVIALGHGPSDYLRLPARDADAAERLADAVVRGLAALVGPWSLVLRNLPVGDPTVAAVRARLGARTVTRSEAGAPQLELAGSRELADHVRADERRKRRRALRRVAEAGYGCVLERLRDPAAVAAVLPEVEAVCRARDAQLGRASQFDDPCARRFFFEAVTALAHRNAVVLTTLRLDGRLAAHALVLVDGAAHRLWNNRIDPAFARFGLGWVTHLAAIEDALADPEITTFDWMAGEEDYKQRVCTAVVPAERLQAWSSRPARLLGGGLVRAQRWAARRHPRLAESAKRLLQGGHR